MGLFRSQAEKIGKIEPSGGRMNWFANQYVH